MPKRMAKFERMENLLTALRDIGAKVTGSFATGHYHYSSDIDLVVDSPEEDGFGDRIEPTPMKEVIKVFEEFDVPGSSFIVGQWSSPRDMVTLPRPVEVMESMWLTPEANTPDTAAVMGVVFPVWKGDSA